MPESKCRSCGQPVRVVPSGTTGTLMHFDPEPTPEGEFVFVDGKAKYVGSGLFSGDKPRYLTHATTCPDAAGWRRSGRRTKR